MSMKASFELPTKHINQLKEYQDYDFVLAHLVLKSEEYRSAYGPGNVLDNGFYELGEPLNVNDLSRAVKLAKPRVVIAPDWQDDVKKTLEAYRDASVFLDAEVAGVVVGNSIDEMITCYEAYLKQKTEIVCLPFRLDRIGFLTKVAIDKTLDRKLWYHFLGLRSMEELASIKRFNLEYTSVDTSKPIKAAIYNKPIHANLRGLGHIDFDAVLDNKTLERCRFNMIRFREEAQAP